MIVELFLKIHGLLIATNTIVIITDLVKQPSTKYDLKKVVNDECFSELEGLSFLHQLRTDDLDEESVSETDKKRWPWTTHQEPVFDPWI